MNKMPFFVAILFINTICFVLYTNPAYAQGVSLSTYPSTIQLRAQQGATAQAGLTIENKSNKPVSLTIALKPFEADPQSDGKPTFIEGTTPAIFKRIKIFDNNEAVNSLVLAPKQSKQLSVAIAIEANEPATDHYFSIVFLPREEQMTTETTKDATAHSAIQAGIASNVLLSTGPNEIPNGFLEEFSTEPFRTSGPVPFTIKIRNNGKHYFSPKGVILIKNIFNQTVGKIDLQNANILAGTSRSLTGIPYMPSANKKPPILTASPLWPEKFLLGLYTAEVSIALSDEGPLLTHSTSFIAIPLKVIGGIVIGVVFGILIFLRIRGKIKNI